MAILLEARDVAVTPQCGGIRDNGSGLHSNGHRLTATNALAEVQKLIWQPAGVCIEQHPVS